jgi:hypothetical protein
MLNFEAIGVKKTLLLLLLLFRIKNILKTCALLL